jgi:hypothetical protein
MVYPDGTVNRDGSGSDCWMLVSSISVVPERGSLDLISTGTFKAVETQVVRTIAMACVLPIAPAGMVSVTSVPVAVTELMVSVPRLTVAIWIPVGGLGRAGGVPPVVEPEGAGSGVWTAVIFDEFSTYR